MKKGNTRANLSIDEKVWRHFRALCVQEGTDASSVVERFMRQHIAEQKSPNNQYEHEKQGTTT